MLKKITKVEEIVVYSNRYGTLYDDQVLGREGKPGRYLRWTWAHDAVIVVPFDGTAVALTRNYRYAIGAESLEFPRGFRNHEEAAEAAAVRELLEETGLVCNSTQCLGLLTTDSGLISNQTVSVVAHVSSRSQRPRHNEPLESIERRVLWLDAGGLREHVTAGKIECGITLSVIAQLFAGGLIS